MNLIGSHGLYDKLISKKTVTGEDDLEESELKYLQEIRNIRENNEKLFEKIKHLPKKVRTSKISNVTKDTLLTYFRKGKLEKFFATGGKLETNELDFITAAKLLKSTPDDSRQKIPHNFYEFLDKNKDGFNIATAEDKIELAQRRGRDIAKDLFKILKLTKKNSAQFTEEQETYIKRIITQIQEGGIPKQTIKKTTNNLLSLKGDLKNPFIVLSVLQANIPDSFLKNFYAENNSINSEGKKEVVLSMYLT